MKGCVVVLCGLPGVGKTSFAKILVSAFSKPNAVHGFSKINCFHIEYDERERDVNYNQS
jgi:broad-specificity NMP kinase